MKLKWHQKCEGTWTSKYHCYFCLCSEQVSGLSALIPLGYLSSFLEEWTICQAHTQWLICPPRGHEKSTSFPGKSLPSAKNLEDGVRGEPRAPERNTWLHTRQTEQRPPCPGTSLLASFKDIKVQDTGFEILHWVLVDFRKERVHNRLTFITCKGMGFPGGSAGKESACNAGDLGFDPLEKGKATHSSILAWRIPWTV